MVAPAPALTASNVCWKMRQSARHGKQLWRPKWSLWDWIPPFSLPKPSQMFLTSLFQHSALMQLQMLHAPCAGHVGCANKITIAGNTSKCCTSAFDAVEWPAQFGPRPVFPQLHRHSWGAGRARQCSWPAVQCRLLALEAESYNSTVRQLPASQM